MKKKLIQVFFLIGLFVIISLGTSCHSGKKGDLGMKMTVELQGKDILQALSGYSKDSIFERSIALADEMKKTGKEDYISLFEKAWNKVSPGGKMTTVFGFELKDRIKVSSTNADVLKAIRAEINEAAENTVKIMNGRLDAYGLSDFKVEKLPYLGQISIEIQGVDNTSRVKNLLLASANLEFWETYEYKDVYTLMEQADKQALSMTGKNKVSGTQNTNDSTKGNESFEDYARKHPLIAYLQPALAQDEKGNYYPCRGPAVGNCRIKDTARVDSMMRFPEVRAVFPREMRFAWTVKAADEKNPVLQFVALKSLRDGTASLNGSVITDARNDFGQNNTNEISISMNAEGARIWRRMTADNIGKSIAIVLDGYVYSFPTVQGEIPNGRSSITGNFTVEEAKDLASILKIGKFPAKLQIIEETFTGGKRSGER